MQITADTDVPLTEDERRLGFTVQTLTYPEGGYELSGLRDQATNRLERTAALIVDDLSRIRRRRHHDGYVLETLDGGEWRVAAEFATADEVAASDAYRSRSVPPQSGESFADAE